MQNYNFLLWYQLMKSQLPMKVRITDLSGLLTFVNIRNNMHDTLFWVLNSLFLSPPFLKKKALELHLALVTITVNIYITLFTSI